VFGATSKSTVYGGASVNVCSSSGCAFTTLSHRQRIT
jgi:hypothetical protein